MDSERASRSIVLVLVSSLAVFAGWGVGDALESTSEPAQAARPQSGGHGARVFWYQSRYYYGSGGVSGGRSTAGGRSGASSPSVRGGFGSVGHGAGA
jgi:hypothetical protein